MTKHLLGSVLGGYRLVERLGTGGVGEVYRARDEKLARDVAVKVLHPAMAHEPDRLRRFEQEARAASALAHPSIVHIYDVGNEDGTPYIAMELVEGATLRHLIASGPLPTRQLLDLALQLAEGLAKAHEGGIIHRDLKPENVLVSRDGYVKIVDFGLAKLVGPAAHDEAVATVQGVVLGTAAYMSPEQASGETVDSRSDQFSLGSIVYEMACGEPAFHGRNFASTLAAVVRAGPEPLTAKGLDLPDDIEAILGRCLAKRPQDRFDSTAELVGALRDARERWSWSRSGPAESGAAAYATRTGSFASMLGRGRRRRWIVAISLTALIGALAWSLVPDTEPDEGEPGRRLRLLVSRRHPDGRARDPALAPDGTMFAYVRERDGRLDVFVARTDGGDHLQLTDDETREANPAFGPNGSRLVFERTGSAHGEPEICIMPILGGRIHIVSTGAGMPTFAPDGEHVAYIRHRPSGGDALAVAGTDGSDERVLLESDGGYPFLYQPAFSPDGELIALRRSSGGVAGEIWLVPIRGAAPQPLRRDPPGVFAHDPAWSADGRSVVVSSNRAGAVNLWRIPIDGGAPQALTTGPGPDELPSVSRSGRIAFSTTSWRYTLRLFNLESGTARRLLDHHAYIWAPAFSPGGDEIVFSQAETDGGWQLWRIPAGGGGAEALTEAATGAVYPRYLPDSSLLFNTWATPRRLMLLEPGVSPPRALSEVAFDDAYGDPSPDGRHIAFARRSDGDERIFVSNTEDGTARQLIAEGSSVPRWSPDGTLIAYAPDRSVRGGIFVVDADGGNRRQLTATGGWPVWWPDGDHIGFLAAGPDNTQVIRIVPLDGGPARTIEALRYSGTNHPFDVSPDGRTLVTSDSMPLDDEIWLLEPGD